jgi:hypothetical protein
MNKARKNKTPKNTIQEKTQYRKKHNIGKNTIQKKQSPKIQYRNNHK